jgi:hypothetical protein
MSSVLRFARIFAVICGVLGCATAGRPATPPDDIAGAGGVRRVVLVTVDGVRWQELFRGAERGLLAVAAAAGAEPATVAAFMRGDAEGARRALLPFLWNTIAREGQLWGNRDRGSAVRVSNPRWVSYPGYHELLVGFARPSIADNSRRPNPDVTVLEWLHRRPGFAGRVAAYVSWDAFPYILNRARSGIPVSQGEGAGLPEVVDRLRREAVPPWRDSVYDAFVLRAAVRALETHAPRVLYVALGDTDEWAHAGRYDRYLEALHRTDAWLAELWRALQALDGYRGRTSLIVTTDHGRGQTPATWHAHNAETPGSDQVWVAALGPAVAPAGERAGGPPVTLAQVAATVAALAGEDYRAVVTAAAPPLPLGAPSR